MTMTNTNEELVNWINEHDCGVSPCAILRGGNIIVRVICVNASTKDEVIEETIVSNLREARIALGY